MILRRCNASVWHDGSSVVRYGINSSTVNGSGCATWASSACTSGPPRRCVSPRGDGRGCDARDSSECETSAPDPVVVNRGRRVFANKQARREAHVSHFLEDRRLRSRDAIPQRLEFLLPLGATLCCRFERRDKLRDVLHVGTQRLLVRPDRVETAVDAVAQATEVFLPKPPFCLAQLRWSIRGLRSTHRPAASQEAVAGRPEAPDAATATRAGARRHEACAGPQQPRRLGALGEELRGR